MEYGTRELNSYLTVFHRHGYTVLELHGELDIAAELLVTPYADAMTTRPCPRVVLDLTPAEFLDCSGLRLIERTHRRVMAQGGVLWLVCPHPRMLWLLRATRLDAVLHPVATLEQALGAGRSSV